MRMGYGHVMRCLSLADKLKTKGCSVYFACRNWPGNAGSLIQQRGFLVVWVDVDNDPSASDQAATINHWLGVPPEQDVNACKAALSGMHIDWLVVDHYGIDAVWHRAMRSQVGQILVIDDLADRDYDCDLLLDQTFGRTQADYSHHVASHCMLLLGSEYALLRPAFSRLRFSSLDRRHGEAGLGRILVAMGGTDPDNLTSQVLEGLSQVDWKVAPNIDVVLGSGSNQTDKLRRQAQAYVANVRVLENVTNMAELMRDADLAIGAGGITSWERCCMGLPSLVVESAANQSLSINNLTEIGAVKKLNAAADLSTTIFENITDCINNPQQMSQMTASAATVTRGLGADLVSAHLFARRAKDGGAVVLRPAEKADMKMVHTWQSDKKTRRFSHNTRVPTLDEHVQWYKFKLADPNSYFFIVLHNGIDSGVLRLDRLESDKSELLVSIYTAPGHYRQGLASIALEYAIELFHQSDLIADVLSENTSSIRLFNSVGFKQVGAERFVRMATESA